MLRASSLRIKIIFKIIIIEVTYHSWICQHIYGNIYCVKWLLLFGCTVSCWHLGILMADRVELTKWWAHHFLPSQLIQWIDPSCSRGQLLGHLRVNNKVKFKALFLRAWLEVLHINFFPVLWITMLANAQHPMYWSVIWELTKSSMVK